MFFNIGKRIKKRLRRVKRPVWSLGILLIVVLFVAIRLVTADSKPTAGVIEALSKDPQEREVYLRKEYVCGQETTSLGLMQADEIIRLLQQHPEWSGHTDMEGAVWLVEHIEDLSDDCKQNGYISLDKAGNLSLFDGPPDREKVLRTFFQLDIESMESSLPDHIIQELREGIRVSDFDEYNSVISTFSDYAVDDTEHVMKYKSESESIR